MNFRTIWFISRIISFSGLSIILLSIIFDIFYGTDIEIFKILTVTEFLAFYIGLIIAGIVFEMVMNRRELRKAASIIDGRAKHDQVTAEEFNLNKGRHSIIINYKTKVKLSFEVKSGLTNWAIILKHPKATSKEIETKRIRDWLRDMKAKGFGIKYIDNEDKEVNIYLNFGGFDGQGLVDFAHGARAFLGLEAPAVFGKEEPGGVKKRDLTPVEKEMELRTNNKDWGAMKYMVAGFFITMFIGIGMIVLSPMLSVLGWALAFICGLLGFIMSGGWYLHIKTIKEIEAGILIVTNERITWVYEAAEGTDDDDEEMKNHLIIKGEDIYFPNAATFKYKIGDKATVERYPSGRVFKVDGIRIDIF